MNVAAGVMSIICTSKGQEALWGLRGYEWGFIFIGIAAIADFFDGFMARLLKAYSEMGKELDSLCDLVSFGVAPAMSLYFCLSETGAQPWTRWVAIIIPVAGALRLAKFNIDTRQTTSFIGLPIPANAIFWIGYVALAYQGSSPMAQWWCVVPVILIESYLMVSELKLFSLKFKTWGWKGNEFRWLLIATAPVLVFCMGAGGLMWLILAYILYGIMNRV